MSVGVQCGSCGRRFRVSDERAGTEIPCECGQTVMVEGQRYIDKVCLMCGIDVSSLTRTRDPSGNYWCQPCWDEALRQKRVAEAAQADPEMRWVTRKLSQVQFKRTFRPLVMLAMLLLLVLTFFVREAGQYVGAALLVLGGGMLAACSVWLFLIPFRDGSRVGFACMFSRRRRQYWATKNPDFNLRRPASLAITGLWLLLLSAIFFAVAKSGEKYREGLTETQASAES